MTEGWNPVIFLAPSGDPAESGNTEVGRALLYVKSDWCRADKEVYFTRLREDVYASHTVDDFDPLVRTFAWGTAKILDGTFFGDRPTRYRIYIEPFHLFFVTEDLEIIGDIKAISESDDSNHRREKGEE